MGPIHKMQPTCHKCGKNLALVGRIHNCTPLLRAMANNMDNTDVMANSMANTPLEPILAPDAYKYRDPEKRRAYMRELMRKKRAK
jgi:hypothetical protein